MKISKIIVTCNTLGLSAKCEKEFEFNAEEGNYDAAFTAFKTAAKTHFFKHLESDGSHSREINYDSQIDALSLSFFRDTLFPKFKII